MSTITDLQFLTRPIIKACCFSSYFLHVFYMLFRFWTIGKFSSPKPKIVNPTWDMVFVAVLLLYFGIQTLLAMNLRIG
jgi:hypothetical protein